MMLSLRKLTVVLPITTYWTAHSHLLDKSTESELDGFRQRRILLCSLFRESNRPAHCPLYGIYGHIATKIWERLWKSHDPLWKWIAKRTRANIIGASCLMVRRTNSC